jgi:hypothetical protein
MRNNEGVNGRSKKNTRSESVRRDRSQGQKFEYEVLETRQLLAGFSPDGQWLAVSSSVVQTGVGQPLMSLQSYGLFDLQEQAIQKSLAKAPLEFTHKYQTNAVTITIPRPDSTWTQFKVVESPIMESGLAAQYPTFKTYRGWGVDDPSETVRFDLTIHGFRAQVLSQEGNYYIDPYFKGQTEFYSSYYKRDVIRQNNNDSSGCGCGGCGCGCGCSTSVRLIDEGTENPLGQPFMDNFGTQLRTFRLANAATGEYTQFWGGTVSQGQAAIVTAINRVNQIYERDLAIRMVLVANNSNLVYTNPNTDPYTNNNGSTMLGQNQTTVDSVIGNANYDIGHVFSTGGGGIAGLGVVGVTGQKARGVTGLPSPTGDPFYIDYVAHEIGHQFNANHTFNGTQCGGGRVASSAYEPGSGVTIMGYAGICGSDNLANFSDAMFHARSIDEIRNFITGPAAGVGTNTNTGNAVPTVSTLSGFVIPANTPFELTAIGSDANSGQVLTYSWEQYNLGSSVSLSSPDNGSSPIFRTWLPTTSPTRTFPRLSNLVNNTVPIGEKLPTTNWSNMSFRVVVRDNASGGGGVNWTNMSMQVVNTGAGFLVTSHNSASSWTGNSTQTLTWNVAGTTASGINASTVDILLSTDGGFTYSTVLASGVANNGSANITVPNISTSTARYKSKAANNVFFDINNANITITPSNVLANVSGPSMIPEGDAGTSIANFTISLSAPASNVVTVNYATNNTGFANPATPGSDYTHVSGIATFQPGQTTFNVPVTIFGDRFTEGIEQFRMTLSNPSGAQLGTSTFVGSINDDDAFALGRIIDFSPPSGFVLPGATGFSDGPYTSFTGLGWTASNQLSTYIFRAGDDVPFDGVFGNSGNFRIDVPNGNYSVELVFGVINFTLDRAIVAAPLNRFSVTVQGNNHPLDLEAGSYVTRTYSATVTNGQLNIGIQSGQSLAKIAGLVITAAGGRPSNNPADDLQLAWFSSIINSDGKQPSETNRLAEAQSSGRLATEGLPNRTERYLDPDSRLVFQPHLNPVTQGKSPVEKVGLATELAKPRIRLNAQPIDQLDRWFESAELADTQWN